MDENSKNSNSKKTPENRKKQLNISNKGSFKRANSASKSNSIKK